MQSLENTLREAGDDRHVVCLLTQVEGGPRRPGVREPDQAGSGFSTTNRRRQRFSKSLGWTMRDDAGRGWRYVVPLAAARGHIVDISLIETVAKSGAVVIAGGGGGIPVVRDANGARARRRGGSSTRI